MNVQRVRSITALLLIGAVGACSGTGAPSLPNSAAANSKAPVHGSKHKVKAKIRITIPKRKHHRHVKVHGHYISPATQSIAIAITPSGGPVTNANADLTPDTNPNCVLGAGGALTCSISLTLDPGSYTASFTTYDGLLQSAGDPDSFPTGNQLSANQNVPLNIVAGQANLVGVALDGIPTGIAFVPSANSTLTGDADNGFTAAKCGPVNGDSEKVGVYGVDVRTAICGLRNSAPGKSGVSPRLEASTNTAQRVRILTTTLSVGSRANASIYVIASAATSPKAKRPVFICITTVT
jgi:hypothetical protein